jgi:uncharacterized protein (TIGR02145 family)
MDNDGLIVKSGNAAINLKFTTMKKAFLITVLAIYYLGGFSQEKGSFTDPRDGKVYRTVIIGTQTWMAENLAFKPESGYWAYNNDTNNIANHGYLYNWVTAKKACPAGWHIPSDKEWKILITVLGGESVAGGKLKESGLSHWQSPNIGATNESGLTALPGGFRNGFGVFSGLDSHGIWWSGSFHNSMDASYWFIAYDNTKITKRYLIMTGGCSVLCVKDN